MVTTKVFKVDSATVSVFGTEIDGLVKFTPPKAANREKSAITTIYGCAGFNSRIIPGETSFEITSISDSYSYLNELVDGMEIGTIVFSIPGTIYTMFNAVISTVEPDDVSDGAPNVTIGILYTRVSTKTSSY